MTQSAIEHKIPKSGRGSVMNQNVRRTSAKKCTVCLEEKVDNGKNWYRNSKCAACYMNEQRKSRPEQIRSAKLKCYYGISVEQFNKMLKQQNNSCAVCGRKNNKLKNGKSQNFVVDHCHSTKKVRGLLCHTCNMRVGIVENWHEQIIEYLAKH